MQAFWPSIVMKKWLNIKPKVNDFSEDEVDTETESEDDGILLSVLFYHILFPVLAGLFSIFFTLLVSFNFHPACSIRGSRMCVREDNPHPLRTEGVQSIFPSVTSGNSPFIFSILVLYRRQKEKGKRFN